MTEQQALLVANEKRSIAEKLQAYRVEEANTLKAVKLARAELMAAITSETNGDGKPKYSNAEKRDAELAIREQGHALHMANLARLDEIARSTATLHIDHEFASDMLKIAVAFPEK